MNKVGYIYQIDKGDYNYVFIITKDRLSKDEIKDFIVNKFNDYFKEINVWENELYITKDLEGFNIEDNVISELEHWKYFNETDININEILHYGLTKQINHYKIEMPTTDRNIWEKYEEKWSGICECVFGYNGASTYVCEECLDEAIKFLQMVKKEWKEFKKEK